MCNLFVKGWQKIILVVCSRMENGQNKKVGGCHRVCLWGGKMRGWRANEELNEKGREREQCQKTESRRERSEMEMESQREPRWGIWDDGLAVSKHQAVFQGCQAHCEALFEMPRLMADIFPMNLARQATVHYALRAHPHVHKCACLAKVIARPWPIRMAGIRKGDVKRGGLL